MSPIMTAARAPYASFAHEVFAKHVPDWVERPFARIGQHAKEVGHSHGRNHHWKQKDQAEESPARQMLHAQQRQAQPLQLFQSPLTGDEKSHHN
jgi:hypothetical protein